MYKKLINIQSKLKAPKSQYNSFGKYSYRNVEDILESLKPLLLENDCSLMIFDEIVMVGERYYIKATVRFIDNETSKYVETTGFAREENEKKGMDSMQLTGATSSYARKYALNGMFAIDDTKDSDTTNTHGKSQNEPSGETETPKGTNNQHDVKNPSQAQLNRLYAIANTKGRDKKTVDAAILSKYKVSTDKLTLDQYKEVIKVYENMQ